VIDLGEEKVIKQPKPLFLEKLGVIVVHYMMKRPKAYRWLDGV